MPSLAAAFDLLPAQSASTCAIMSRSTALRSVVDASTGGRGPRSPWSSDRCSVVIRPPSQRFAARSSARFPASRIASPRSRDGQRRHRPGPLRRRAKIRNVPVRSTCTACVCGGTGLRAWVASGSPDCAAGGVDSPLPRPRAYRHSPPPNRSDSLLTRPFHIRTGTSPPIDRCAGHELLGSP
jgi:hypothetical protein